MNGPEIERRMNLVIGSIGAVIPPGDPPCKGCAGVGILWEAAGNGQYQGIFVHGCPRCGGDGTEHKGLVILRGSRMPRGLPNGR